MVSSRTVRADARRGTWRHGLDRRRSRPRPRAEAADRRVLRRAVLRLHVLPRRTRAHETRAALPDALLPHDFGRRRDRLGAGRIGRTAGPPAVFRACLRTGGMRCAARLSDAPRASRVHHARHRRAAVHPRRRGVADQGFLQQHVARDAQLLWRAARAGIRRREQAATARSIHGTILHGTQYLAPELAHSPTTYYTQTSGIGRVLESLHPSTRPLKVGIIGLGTGTIATYGSKGDIYRFYDINPAVITIANRDFSYLKDSEATIETALGDARLTLEREPPQQFDVLAIDAFSSDAIPDAPAHAEALAIYRKHMKPGGIIAFHVTNRYLDLAPVVQRLAEAQGMHAVMIYDDTNEGMASISDWVLVADDAKCARGAADQRGVGAGRAQARAQAVDRRFQQYRAGAEVERPVSTRRRTHVRRSDRSTRPISMRCGALPRARCDRDRRSDPAAAPMGDRAHRHVPRAAHAIRSMQVRGAPLIGATAAYGLALALRSDASRREPGCGMRAAACDAADRSQPALGARSLLGRGRVAAAASARRRRMARSRRHRGRRCGDESCHRRAWPAADRAPRQRTNGPCRFSRIAMPARWPRSRWVPRPHPSTSPTSRGFRCTSGSAKRARACRGRG